MITKTEAIANFLNQRALPDLARLYNYSMEVQVNVRQGRGQRISDEYKGRHWTGYTDGFTTWKAIRIPWNAKTNPKFEDSEMTYDLYEHAEGIGLTGWDWEHRYSRWVGYDYDAIVGHSDRHNRKLSEGELRDLERAIAKLPYTTLRQSTGGRGRHLYVFVNDVPTANHDEHAALARAILGKMSGHVGYDFNSKVDIQGHILWIWHRKFEDNREEGLKLLKQGDILTEIPPNWRDHIPVISGRKLRAVPSFVIEANDEDDFLELSGQATKVPLDPTHRKLLDWLEENQLQSWWDNDHHLLVSHTAYLDQAHKELGLKGVFKTLATGTEYGQDHNCFCFPMRHGAWAIRRFSRGCSEAETWTQDSKGWTRTVFNREPDFDMACAVSCGSLNDKDGYVFTEAELAAQAVSLLGTHIEMPAFARGRKTILRKNRSQKLVIEINREESDSPIEMRNNGFIPERKVWQKVLPINLEPSTKETEIQNFDDIVRHMITEDNEDYGWAVHSEGTWKRMPLENIKMVMEALGQNPKEARQALGNLILKSWTVVNRPFQPEYLENRVWNMNAVQFKVVPNREDNRRCPTWMKILNHVGNSLDDAVKRNEWCQMNGILTGADYLKCWLAALVQHPLQQLPYLFLYGPENSGKTIFAESLRFLFTGGIARGDMSLINQAGFNAELEHAIIATVEEIDLGEKGNKMAINRIKDWVTAKELSIHRKQKTPYMQPNSTHWIQTANDPKFCPVFPGDTRIVVIRVDEIAPENKIPRLRFDELLMKEASDFLGELVMLELPEPIDRLYIPVILTDEKSQIQESNMDELQLYLKENYSYVEGSMILLKDFKNDFHDWLVETGNGEQVNYWTRMQIPRKLPLPYTQGRSRSDNYNYIINISKDPNTPPKKKLEIRDDGNKGFRIYEVGER